MAFGGGGFFGSGAKQTSTTQNTTNITDEAASQVSGDESIGIGRANDVQLIMTDQGAVGGAFDFSRDALNEATAFAGNFGDRAFSTVEKSLAGALDFGENAIENLAINQSDSLQQLGNIQRDALSEVATTQRESTQALVDTQSGALDAIGDLFSGVTNFIGDLQKEAQKTLGSTVTALNTIASENSKSSDQRVAEISENAIKYVVGGLAVLGLIAAIAYRGK